jgi:hypothetical protein
MAVIQQSVGQGDINREAKRFGGDVDPFAGTSPYGDVARPEGPKGALKGASVRGWFEIIRGWAGADTHAIQENQFVEVQKQGYAPQWKYIAPLGLQDNSALASIYDIYSLFPVDNRGPGDNPITYLQIGCEPVLQNFAMRMQGIPVQGGNMLLTGLYTPDPIVPPGQP